MNKHCTTAQKIDQIDAEMQEIMVELENLISQKYEQMDYEQKSINTEAFLQFFDRVMAQISKE
ncbi:MAG: hypothetical protein Q8M43_10370 [Sulfuricurvum sp.]|uniref:hypothetical protein n=1 Tax=Sulfuricurvum sp. TaxID=2025608 RepID=UPI0027336B21|nr:hypothetical protein [Sulfuricurvum sp.]MDP3292422.1 hypothetical protein [Sulfuricurvum sp.]